MKDMKLEVLHFPKADEVPGILSANKPRQASEKDDKIQLRAQPVTVHINIIIYWN